MFPTIPAACAAITDWIDVNINPWLWTLANIELGLFFFFIAFYVVFYWLAFDIHDTEAGERIYSTLRSLFWIALLGFIGTYVNPHLPFYVYPEDTFWWRPLLRVILYGVVTLSIFRLDLLVFNRWRHGSPMRIELTPKYERLRRGRRHDDKVEPPTPSVP
jgi:hypothetical protein